ncbi:MAG: TonB family protein [Deltaproteobacteria bacterium]|nr:TonB family protein [Deltaproteobacteria bacterium]
MKHYSMALLLALMSSNIMAQENTDITNETEVTPPKLLKFVEATYPPAEKAAHQQAQVVLAIAITTSGEVEDVEVITSAGKNFDEAAINAARQFRFAPALVGDQAVPVKITYRYEFVIKEEMVSKGPQINFAGVVRERFKKQPIPGVKVRIVDLNIKAITDAEGAFAFIDVPIGKHAIELSAESLVTVRTEEEIAKDKKKSVTYHVEEKEAGIDEEVVVRAARIKKESVETSIQTAEARQVPGTQGDTLKVVQNLPGVGRSSFGSGQLVVWGSAPAETRVNIDGVEIPSLYHVGGMRSVVNSDLVKSIDLIPGAFGAEYGRGTGGLVRVETSDLPPKGFHGYIATDVIDTAALITAAPSKNLRIALAGRYSYLDKTLSAVTSKDVGDFVPIPHYNDWQAMFNVRLRKDENLQVLILGANDSLRRTVYSEDPAEIRREDNDTFFSRLILRYSRLFTDGSSIMVTPSIGIDRSDQRLTFGAIPVHIRNNAWRYGLRFTLRQRVNANITLIAGSDVSGSSHALARQGSLTLPAREGDPTIFGLMPGDEIAADKWKVNFVSGGLFTAGEISFGDLTLTPSLRFEPVLIDGSRLTPKIGESPTLGYTRIELAFDPRISASMRFGKLTLTAGGGVYHQPPDPQELSAVFGNPTLGLTKAYHATFGAAYKLTGTLSVETVTFAKLAKDLVSRSALATPPLARSLVQDGRGRSYGGQVLLRQQLVRGFFGWLSYSLIRSERQDHPQSDWRLFDYDQTHVVALLASYDFGNGFVIGSRLRYTTGYPRTPVIGAWFDARTDYYQPKLGAYNSIRMQPFFAADARIEYSRLFSVIKFSIFLEVENFTNRKNQEEIIYNYDFSHRETITGLPTLAILGGKLEF